MRAAVGYLIGATVSLSGGVADLAYINVRLVPRMIEPKVEPVIQPEPEREPEPQPQLEAKWEPEPEPPPIEIAYERAALIQFKTDSDELDRDAHDQIDGVARQMLDDRTLVARTDGYADERGPPEYNRDLSDRRAAAVVRELEQLGVNGERIERRAFGEETAGRRWRFDRRVEVSIGKQSWRAKE